MANQPELDDLRKYISKLEEAFDTVETELRESYKSSDPYVMKDLFGRFILLDALTALVLAKASLRIGETFGDG